MEAKFTELKTHLQEINDLESAGAVLNWDRMTKMPPGGTTARVRQMTTLSRLVHERYTSDKMGDWLETLDEWAKSLDYGSDEAGLVRLAKTSGAGLAVTPSRRTGAANEAVLREGLAAVPSVIWDGEGENPYFGYLALADAIVVTADSVSMVSEACATGKPVYVFDLEGGSRKFKRFHDNLREAGITRAFEGTLAEWRYRPPDDTERVAREVRRRMRRAAAGQDDATCGARDQGD